MFPEIAFRIKKVLGALLDQHGSARYTHLARRRPVAPSPTLLSAILLRADVRFFCHHRACRHKSSLPDLWFPISRKPAYSYRSSPRTNIGYTRCWPFKCASRLKPTCDGDLGARLLTQYVGSGSPLARGRTECVAHFPRSSRIPVARSSINPAAYPDRSPPDQSIRPPALTGRPAINQSDRRKISAPAP
jgi:hypothetical protein